MTRRSTVLGVAALIAVSGVAGGLIGARMTASAPAAAQAGPGSGIGGPSGVELPVVTGGRFVLLDPTGAQRAVVEVGQGGAARIQLNGPNSRGPSVDIAADDRDGSRVTLSDGQGVPRITSGVRSDGSVVSAVLGGRDLIERAALRVEPDGLAGLDIRDPQGRLRASLGTNRDGAPFLAFLDETGNVVWSTP